MPGSQVPVADSARRRPIVGWTLGAIAVIHLALAPVLYQDSWDSIVEAGVWNSIDADEALADLRGAGFWYATAGLGLLWAAVLIARIEKTEGRPPASAVWGLLVLAAWGLLFTPLSGFVAILATAALAAYRRWHAPGLS